MPFLKNIHFTQLIKIDGHLKEFNFWKSNASLETMVTIDTIDERNTRISFSMHCVGNKWKIIQTKLPAWIFENENRLNEVINQELASQEIYLVLPEHNSYWQLNRLLGMFGFN